MAMTCGADDVTDAVIVLKDISGLSYNSLTQTPTEFSHADWTLEQIGNIYFTEFDNHGNIYGTASAFTQQDVFPSNDSTPARKQYGSIGGSGAVYKFDAVTGAPTLFATLPQEGGGNSDSGLGGITHYATANNLYVVNMFNNTIYRLNDTTGAIIDSYQPDPNTLGTASGTTASDDAFTNFQAVPFGLDIYDGRLYYTVHDATSGGSLVVRSVGLAPDGAMTGSDISEINQVIPNTLSGLITANDRSLLADPLVADIDFSPSGQMAVGTFSSGPAINGEFSDKDQRSFYADGDTNSIYNHASPNYIFTGSSGSWTQTSITSVGQENHGNFTINATSTGGVSWNLDPANPETLWMSGGDFKGEDSKWGIIGYDSTQLDNLYTQEDAANYIQFLFTGQESTDPKGNGSDVDVFCPIPPLEVGNYLWLDADRDGIQDPDELPLANVDLVITDPSGITTTVTSGSNGEYYFLAEPGAEYKILIEMDQPALADVSLTSPDINTPVKEFIISTGGIGESDHTQDFGFTPYVSIGSTLFYDYDDSGTQDAGEPGIPGILVVLYDSVGDSIAGDITDSDGNYYFGNLFADDYQIRIPNPPPDAPTSSTPTDNNDNQEDGDDNGVQLLGPGTIVTSTLISLGIDTEPTGEAKQGGDQDDTDDNNGDMTIDFGFVPYVSIGSTLFYDLNDNGFQDPGETGIANIPVELRDTAGNLVASTTTDGNGDYYFGELYPGDYQVVIPTPPADAPTSSMPTDLADNQEDGDDNGNQPGGSGEPVTSPVITLTMDGEPVGESGQNGNRDGADDNNGDMTVDFGFVPYVSIGSTLFYDPNDNGFQDSGEAGIPGIPVELHDSAGNLITSTTTDSKGDYYFGGLLAGEYQVVIPIPPVHAPTSSPFTDLADNQEDGDDNGDQPDGPGGAVTSPIIMLTIDGEPTNETKQGSAQDDADDNNGDMTVDFGFIPDVSDPDMPMPYVSIGSTLFYDNDNSGTQDEGEAGIPDITVELYDNDGNLVTLIITDENGNYYFGGLLAGDYQVVIPTPPSDASTSSTPTDLADNQEDGDDNGDQPDGAGGAVTSPMITLTIDGEPTTETAQGGDQDDNADDDNGDMTVDFGFIPDVSVGDFVWYDNDKDGIQTDDELGVPGVAVNVFNSDGTPATDMNGEPVPAQMTDDQGKYLFTNLPPGAYYVSFDLTTLPDEYMVTTLGSGDDDGVDSDGNPETGQTSPTDFLPGGSEDLTLDLGIQPVRGSTTNLIWLDTDGNNVQDPDEIGLDNIRVFLNQDGEVIAETMTDEDGSYTFDDLEPGSYYITFAPPADLELVTGVETNTENLLRGPDIVILGGGNISVLDIGFTQMAVVNSYVWLDANYNGVIDMDESGVPGAVVHLLDATGKVLEITATDSEGHLKFEVPMNEYQLQFILPDDTEFTLQNQGTDENLNSDVDPTTGLIGILDLSQSIPFLAGLVPIEPTALRLTSLVVREITSGVAVEWGARLDSATFGFEVYRSNDGNFENAVAVTEGVIQTSAEDDIYQFIDTTVQDSQVYTYWVVERMQNQQTDHYGPVGVVTGHLQQIFLPVIQR